MVATNRHASWCWHGAGMVLTLLAEKVRLRQFFFTVF